MTVAVYHMQTEKGREGSVVRAEESEGVIYIFLFFNDEWTAIKITH